MTFRLTEKDVNELKIIFDQIVGICRMVFLIFILNFPKILPPIKL